MLEFPDLWLICLQDYFITKNGTLIFSRTFDLREVVRNSIKENKRLTDTRSAVCQTAEFYYSYFHQFSVEPVILQIFSLLNYYLISLSRI